MTWLLDPVIKLALNLKMVRLCVYGTVLFYSCYFHSFFLLFPYPVIPGSSNKTTCLSAGVMHQLQCLKLKVVLTRAFCSRNNDAVETCLICTKHCKCIITDPLWQIFSVFSHFGMRRPLSRCCGEQEATSIYFKKMFWFFPSCISLQRFSLMFDHI